MKKTNPDAIMKKTNKVHLDMNFRMLHDDDGFFVEVCSARVVQRVRHDDKNEAYMEMIDLLRRFADALVLEVETKKPKPDLEVVK